jgi:hypothetical protein
MANFTPVKPGDLITAVYFNQVLGSFDTRISALESSIGASGGAMVITGLSPSGPLHMGDTVTVLGQNFGLPSQAIVTVAGVTVTGSSFLPGSGNDALIFEIPPVPDIPPLGQTVMLTVSNPTSAASPYSFLLLPFTLTIPTGQLTVTMTGAPSVLSMNAGNTYTFVFTITASTSLTDIYNLAASLDSASKAAGWTVATVQPPPSSGSLNQVSIPQGQNTTTQVGVSVTIPPTAGVTSAQVTLTVTSSTNPTGLLGTGATTVTVGSAPPPPNTIPLQVTAVTANLSGATFSGNNITLPHGTTSAVVAVKVTCPNVDSYKYTGPTFGAGWVGNVVKPTTNPFPASQANQQITIQMQITTVPAGPASTNFSFQVQSTTQASIVGQIGPATISVS